jgi:hypothetical protein
LSRIINPLVGTTVEVNGVQVPRRICVGGVRDLLIEHEPIDVPSFDQESGKLAFGGQVWESETDERKPGEAPHDCWHHAANWWRWCQPGDVIVVDECQRLFRPMASGRRLPKFITMLETHRHYGIDFVFVTQHPQLLHANVRNLVGQYNHVRRVFGSHTTIVYEWDHCTSPDRIKNATSKVWRHDRQAYKLYKSAEVHTKAKHRIPVAVFALLFGIVAVPAMLYIAKDRIIDRKLAPRPAAVSAPAPVAKPASAPGDLVAGSKRESAAVVAVVPVEKAPTFAGCILMAARCECIDVAGVSREMPLEACQQGAQRGGTVVPYPMGRLSPTSAATGPALSALAARSGGEVEPPQSAPWSLSLGGDARAHILTR